jgi:nucleoside-diphosphate-sugar epimerase
MARCLVTGHKGYIGEHLYKKLKELGHEVQGIDLFENHNILHDLREYNAPMQGQFHPHYYDFKPEYIFHLACIPRVSYSVEHPVSTMENNVLATTYILNFARKIGVKRVIYSGSSSVKGNGDGPTSPYGLQKLISEMECKLYSDLYGLDTVSLRYFNVYSEDQEADGPYATAIANWTKYIREGKIPFITGDGKQRRDMTYIDDVVSANIFAMEHKENFNGRHYDVGTGRNVSLNQIKEIVSKYFPDLNFEYVAPRPGDVNITCANILDLEKLGWMPKTKIYDGINKCFRSLKEELNGRE